MGENYKKYGYNLTYNGKSKIYFWYIKSCTIKIPVKCFFFLFFFFFQGLVTEYKTVLLAIDMLTDYVSPFPFRETHINSISKPTKVCFVEFYQHCGSGFSETPN